MLVDGSSSSSSYSPLFLKRRRLTHIDPMEAEAAKAKLAEAKEKFGREIRVFETASTSPVDTAVSENEESDDFYEFTAEDYYRLLGTKKEDKYLKTKKIRDADEASRRARLTKAVIRVRFPDNHTLEATFHPSEQVQSLVDLIKKVVALSELPFYLYTTPPKRQIKDMSQDFYSAGFVPGAIVYFSYDLPRGDDTATTGPFLRDDVMALEGLELHADRAVNTEPIQSVLEPVEEAPTPVVQERKPEKKLVKPKWLKM